MFTNVLHRTCSPKCLAQHFNQWFMRACCWVVQQSVPINEFHETTQMHVHAGYSSPPKFSNKVFRNRNVKLARLGRCYNESGHASCALNKVFHQGAPPVETRNQSGLRKSSTQMFRRVEEQFKGSPPKCFGKHSTSISHLMIFRFAENVFQRRVC